MSTLPAPEVPETPRPAPEFVAYERLPAKRRPPEDWNVRNRQKHAWESVCKKAPWIWFDISESVTTKQYSALRRTVALKKFRFVMRDARLFARYTGGFATQSAWLNEQERLDNEYQLVQRDKKRDAEIERRRELQIEAAQRERDERADAAAERKRIEDERGKRTLEDARRLASPIDFNPEEYV